MSKYLVTEEDVGAAPSGRPGQAQGGVTPAGRIAVLLAGLGKPLEGMADARNTYLRDRNMGEEQPQVFDHSR